MVTAAAEAIWLEMLATGIKCVFEEIHNNIVVLPNYDVIGDEEHVQANILPTIFVKVTSPFGNNLHHEENITYGQFAFTTTEAGNYMACNYWYLLKNWYCCKDWDSIARKEKIKDVELVLMKLEGRVQAIHEKLLCEKEVIFREEKMREVSEKTNAEVAWFSILSLSVCILATAMQVWYLKRFFRKKKLI
ncbi:transmembrane emp24 domain-containing protein p24delta3-like [Nicotiana tabacum]|uniref:Transmembrane emp24 domain-containing protein p24delta3-like n=1 Tax=Nicotiana tabacum TaxID=4097 RepID=A0AC58TNN4_TOBAC